MEKITFSIVKITIALSFLILSSNISGQNTQGRSQNEMSELPVNSTIKVENQRNSQADNKQVKQNNKVAESNVKSLPQPLPTVDYLKEAERIQREIEIENQTQNKNAQQRIEDITQEDKLERDRLQELNNQTIQRQNDRLNGSAQQQEETFQDFNKQGEAVAKNSADQWKWIWLVLLFEILQTIFLAIFAFKKKVAKKSAIAMIGGLVISLILILYFTVLNDAPQQIAGTQTQQTGFRSLGSMLAIISLLMFFVGKTSVYIIASLIPESLTAKLLSVFGIGLSLTVLYLFLNSISGWGIYGIFNGVGILLLGGIIALVKSNSKKEDLHGSARFSTKKEIQNFETEPEPGAFILSPVDPEGHHGKVSLPRRLSGMHGLILGGSGTGKTRGYIMPNCAEVKNTSIVVTDPKSELWKYTSGFHQKALRFAPTEPDSSQCFNWIPLCTDARMAELCARAIMTAGSTQNTDQFWIDAETAFLSAIFAHTAVTNYPTPLTAYRLFTRKKPDELLQILLNSPSYVAREQAVIFEQTDARIKGAIVPAVASRMQFMRDPNIQLTTSAQLEAPDFGQLRHTPTAVYWCLREQDIGRLRPLTSLFFTVLLEQIAGEAIYESSTSVPITLMLDEFANIGKIPDFETTISLARGRDVALWLGIQSLSQLNQTYGNHAAQTIISNCATKIALHGLDYQTAEYISKSLGEKTVSHSSNSFSFGLSGGSIGSHSAKHRRPLMTPDEVMRLDEDEAIIRTSNKYPMVLYKGYYDEKPNTFPLTQSLTKVLAEGEQTEAEEILI